MMRSETGMVNRLGLAKQHSKRMLFQRCKQRSGVRGGTQKPLAVVEVIRMNIFGGVGGFQLGVPILQSPMGP